MQQKLAYDLCRQLLNAESEDEVVAALRLFNLWDDPAVWHPYGDRENNFSIIGNQQSNPAAALVEKLVNAVDAVLMREVLVAGIDPEGPEAPASIADALERYFDIPGGSLANVTDYRRHRLGDEIGLVATGTKYTPNYLIYDRGEGQTPDTMPATLYASLPSWADVGEEVRFTAIVEDPARPDPFVCEFVRHVIKPQEMGENGGAGGVERLKEVVRDGRLVPEGLALPVVVEVTEEDWPRHHFDRSSALTVKASGDGSYDFFVNVDNVYLKTEQKNYKRQPDPALLEARFKFALVLVGMALLEDHRERLDETRPVEEYVEQVTRAIAPFLIPMIESLGSLEPDDVLDE